MNKKDDKKKFNRKEMEDLIGILEKEKEEYLNGWKRAKADLINYRQNESSRTKAFLKNEKKGTILRMISVLDSLDRAVEEASREKENPFYEGFMKIKEQMESALKKEGVKKVDALKKEFDPLFHEVVEAVKKEGVESGVVVEEMQKGYLMDEELIRPSKIKVAL